MYETPSLRVDIASWKFSYVTARCATSITLERMLELRKQDE